MEEASIAIGDVMKVKPLVINTFLVFFIVKPSYMH